MLTKKTLEEYKKSKKLDFNLNFLINKQDKQNLAIIANKNDISMSELIRILIKEFLKEQKDKKDDN